MNSLQQAVHDDIKNLSPKETVTGTLSSDRIAGTYRVYYDPCDWYELSLDFLVYSNEGQTRTYVSVNCLNKQEVQALLQALPLA